MSLTTEAVVEVKAVQKSLNQMSREERIKLIRAGGDPKISVRVQVRDADAPDAPDAAGAGRREPAQGAHPVVRLPHLGDDGRAGGSAAPTSP